MYRNRPVEQDLTGEQFVTRLYDLPVVHSAVDKLGSFYTGTKEHNRLFRFTLETAESGLGLVVYTTKPVVAKFEKPIGSLNELACHQLVRLERDYPIITQPTDVVLKQTMETCTQAVKPITERVKPVTDRVGSVAQYGITKVNDAKVYTYDAIDGVKTYGVNTVNGVKSYGVEKFTAATNLGSRQVSRLLENQAGRTFLSTVDQAIGLADNYVEKYLPEDEPSKENMSPTKSMEVDELSHQTVVINKALELSSKVRRRAYNHVAKQLKNVKMRSLDTVEKLHFNINLIEYARTNIDCAKNKAYYVWDEINKTPEQMSEETKDDEQTCQNVTYERRAIATARHLTQRLKTSLSGIDLGVDRVPAFVRGQVDKALNLASSLFNLFSSRARTGLTNEDIDVVKNSLGQLRTTLTSFDASGTLKNLPSAAFSTMTTVANAASSALVDAAEYASSTATKNFDVATRAASIALGGTEPESVNQQEVKTNGRMDQSSDDNDNNDNEDDEEEDDDVDQEESMVTSHDEKYNDHNCEHHGDQQERKDN